MDGWVGGWMGRREGEWVEDGWKNRWTDERMGKREGDWVDGRMDGWMDS